MLQVKQHLFRAFFFQKLTSCALHYDVIYHPIPINTQYLKTWRVDTLVCRTQIQKPAYKVNLGWPKFEFDSSHVMACEVDVRVLPRVNIDFNMCHNDGFE